MTFKRFLQKAFVGGQWYVGYRRKGENKYRVIDTPKNMWIADPMMFSTNGEHYLFVEVYENKKKKAAIGYFHFENDVPVYKGVIINAPYHMSYPCVFEYEGIYYMIPESSANNSISLYKAEEFPNKWVKECELIKGEKYVDSTVFWENGSLGVLSYRVVKEGWELVKFDFNMKSKILQEKSVVKYQENIGRPAGYINEKNMRPAQDCREKYGENLLIYQIDSFQPYKERQIQKISAKMINADIKFDRVHTYTEDGTFEVVDMFKDKIDLLHGIKIFCRAYLRK